MYALAVRFDLRNAECATAFDQLVTETSHGIRDLEPGTLVYVTHRVDGAPLARVFYEVYRDRAAFETHEQQEHTRRFLREREQYIDSTRVEFLTTYTAKGLGVADAG